ncbi:MAG: 4Fe-4S dicluster domain-containing protein [Candidatus Omnitrophica bacterium]|nr:4Fe-4S dicluster domain-containing protein [Candidatus Omnitrophota bacterium]
MNIENKLFTVKRKKYIGGSHITAQEGTCRECIKHVCVRICPAEVYEWNETEKKLTINYENCLECGTCRVACEMENINWTNPAGGTGIEYTNS